MSEENTDVQEHLLDGNNEDTKEVNETPIDEEVQNLDGEENEEVAEDGEAEEAPAYVFEDRKVKVMDNEYEIPEHIASAIQSEEQAKEIKEIYEKAYGLDPLKAKRDYFKEQSQNYQSQYQEINNKYTEQSNMLNFYNDLINKGDMAIFQKFTGVSDQMVLDRAAEIIRHNELTPQERAEYNRNIESRQRQYSQDFYNQNQASQADFDAITEQHRKLDDHLDQGQFSGFVNEFDKRNGYGSFKNAVIQRAIQMEEAASKSGQPKVVSIEEAVDSTLNYLGYSQGQSTIPQQNLEQTGTTPEQANSPKVVVQKKPVIPKVTSGGKSPVKKTVKSLDDLRKLADQLEY